MRVRFCADALDAPEAWCHLDIMVLKFFASERHIWDVPNPTAVRKSRWIAGEPTGRWTRQNIAFLEKHVTREAHRPRQGLAHTLILMVAMSSVPPMTLMPSDAEHVLGQPAHVVVENSESDGAFLMAAIRAFSRVALRKMHHKHWWTIVSAGGSGELVKRVEELARLIRIGPLRIVVIKDGDRHTAGQPAAMPTVKVIDEHRIEHDIPVTVLRKREMENYLPLEVLHARAPREKRALLEAFAKLDREQRDHYDMKYGFKSEDGKVRIHDKQKDLFGELDEQECKALCGGFGERIWTLFKDCESMITKTNLLANCPDDPNEIEHILDNIERIL